LCKTNNLYPEGNTDNERLGRVPEVAKHLIEIDLIGVKMSAFIFVSLLIPGNELFTRLQALFSQAYLCAWSTHQLLSNARVIENLNFFGVITKKLFYNSIVVKR